jgi:hypothetical protein
LAIRPEHLGGRLGEVTAAERLAPGVAIRLVGARRGGRDASHGRPGNRSVTRATRSWYCQADVAIVIFDVTRALAERLITVATRDRSQK